MARWTKEDEVNLTPAKLLRFIAIAKELNVSKDTIHALQKKFHELTETPS